MPLHPIKLPKDAIHLCFIVRLHKVLLKALVAHSTGPDTITTAWVQGVWPTMDAQWVRTYCGRNQLRRIQAIAGADVAVRNLLYEEFCRQNKVRSVLQAGGDFMNWRQIPGLTEPLAKQVKDLFQYSYDKLGEKHPWLGYILPGGVTLSKSSYKEAFCSSYPTSVVCPYCDGPIGVPELDHYYCKSQFPLLTCSPWNLVPICHLCNDVIGGKGDQLALDPGPPR